MTSSSSNYSIIVNGIWKRLWEEDPIGCNDKNIDRDTLVLWFQSSTSGIYVDIRLPIDSPGRLQEQNNIPNLQRNPYALYANGYSDNAKQVILSLQNDNNNNNIIEKLCRQKSFAGFIEYKNGHDNNDDALQNDKILVQMSKNEDSNVIIIPLCTLCWNRIIDYQPPTGNFDIGVCVGQKHNDDKESTFLRETGADGSYAEGWLRSSTYTSFMALELISNDRKGFWVIIDNQFAYVIGRRKDNTTIFESECIGMNLYDAIKHIAKGDSNNMLDLLGQYVCVVGNVNNNNNWIIEYSTQPELIGCQLIGSNNTNSTDSCCCSTIEKLTLKDDETTSTKIWRQTLKKVNDDDDKDNIVRDWKIVEMVNYDDNFPFLK